MESKQGEGGCLCGAVRYRFDAAANHSMICHCRTCRRQSGAPMVAWVTLPIEAYRVVLGKPAAYASSEPVQRTFCGACGTPLTYQHRDEPQFIDVTTCSLDDPDAYAPTHHSWTSHDLQWLAASDALPHFPQSRYSHISG
jgi:hypothetical protein